MRIKEVSCIVVDSFRTNWVFALVTLDDGTRGIGESTLIGTEPAVAAMIEMWGERLVGESVHDVSALQARIQRQSYWLMGPVMSAALSALDTALWDAKARLLDVPVYALLGGRARRSVPVYANGWFVGAKTAAEFAEKAKRTADRGFRALKWDPFGSHYRTMDRAAINEAEDKIGSVREAVGRDTDLMIEAHGRFDVATGIDVGRMVEKYNVSWLEEPIPPGRPFELADVRRNVNVPIAAGERCFSRFDVQNLIKAEAIDVLQADVAHIGGLSEMVLVNGIAEGASLPIAPHNPNGPICNAASMHVALAWESVTWLETMLTDVPWRRTIADEGCRLEDGMMTIEDRPGLGVTMDLDAARKHPYQAHQLRHFSGKLTNIRPPDAIAWYIEPEEKSG